MYNSALTKNWRLKIENDERLVKTIVTSATTVRILRSHEAQLDCYGLDISGFMGKEMLQWIGSTIGRIVG